MLEELFERLATDNLQSRISMSGSSRRSLLTNGEKAESIEAIGKRSGSFWIIFESVTLSPA